MANRPNYAKQMDAVLAALGESRPRLLLHACCAPCSSSVLELLERHFAVTILYYDPNIWPDAEYRRRLEELRRFLQASGRADTALIEDKYRPEEFYAAVKGLEAEPERGGRCTVCYRMRMERAAAYAAANGYEWFCTTLSLSPHKDAGRINQIGQALAAKYGVRHLPSEFKKRDGYKRSLVLSGEYGLYRQDYCGCEFSARQSEARRAPAPEAAKTEKERPIMSQREKMHSGELYISMDEDILKEQFVCLEKQYDYNQTRPSEGARRAALLQEMMAECGEGCYIEPPLHANWGGHHVHLGKGVYANFNLTLVDDTHIYIGDYTMLGPNVVLATGGHPLLPELRDETYQYNLPIHIGKSCWLGAGVIVLPGVTIGDGSVIGAGSVVTRDIPPNVLAMGTPCRVVRGLDERDRETYFHGRRIDPDLLKK